MRIQQILVTMFNRRLDVVLYTKALDRAWLEYRWKLFTIFTLPSIAAQTWCDFDWVIFCHENSPSWFKEQTKEICLPCRTIFSFDPADPTLNQLREKCSDVEVALTTRIDSDDAFHCDAMQTIRKAFQANPHDFDVMNFEIGYQYHSQSQRLALLKASSPPFSTKINRSPGSDPLDFGPAHNLLPGLFQSRYRDISKGNPMFVQVVHEGNLLNRMLYTSSPISRPLSRHILRQAFNVDDAPQRAPLRAYLNDWVHWLWEIRRTRGL